jgi:hypothetical protein
LTWITLRMNNEETSISHVLLQFFLKNYKSIQTDHDPHIWYTHIKTAAVVSV